MSELLTIKCDHCEKDIMDSDSDCGYRLRLSEEPRQGNLLVNQPDLQGVMNFCSLSHLKNWVNSL